MFINVQYSVQFSHSVMSDSLQQDELQYARLPFLSPAPRIAQNHVHGDGDAIQPSHPLSSLSPPAFGLCQHQELFPMSQLFTSGGQSIGASASTSVLPMDIQG